MLDARNMATYIGKFLDPGQVETIIRSEKQRRRQLRLNQVRRLAHDNAARICTAVRTERARQTKILARQLENEWLRTKEDNVKVVGDEYSYCLHGVGMAHESVETEKTLLAEKTGQSIRDRICALERGRAALDEVHSERTSSQQQLEDDRRHRKHIRLVENERASLVASLPPPVPVTESSSPASEVDKSGNTSPNKARSDRPKDPRLLIDVQIIAADGETGDARRAAEAEERRLSDQLRQNASEKVEQTRRERQRFLTAKARMEHDRDYNRVLLELEELERLERLEQQNRANFEEGFTERSPVPTRYQEEFVADMFQRMGISLEPDSATKLLTTSSDNTSSSTRESTRATGTGESTTLTSADEPSTPLVHLIIHADPIVSDESSSTTTLLVSSSGDGTIAQSSSSSATGPATSGSAGFYSDGSRAPEPHSTTSAAYSFPDSTTSELDTDYDDPSHVILAGLLHGDRSSCVDSVASPTASMQAKADDRRGSGGSWSGDGFDRSRIQTKSVHKSHDDAGYRRGTTPATAKQQSSESQGSGDSLAEIQPALQEVSIRRPSTDGYFQAPSDVTSFPVFQNVEVVQKTSRRTPELETASVSKSIAADDRSKLLQQLLLMATQKRNILPATNKSQLVDGVGVESGGFDFRASEGKPEQYQGRVLWPKLHAPRVGVTELSTIEEVDTPNVSRTMTDQRRDGADGGLPGNLMELLDCSSANLASMLRRFDCIFEQGEKGISDEPNLTFVSTEPPTQSLDCSLAAASGNVTAESFPDNDDYPNNTTDLFGADSSVGTWWLESFQRMAAHKQLTKNDISDLSASHRSSSTVAIASATLSYQEVVTPVTGTPSCPLSEMSTTDVGDSTFYYKSQLSGPPSINPSSSSSTSTGSIRHQTSRNRSQPIITRIERRQELNMVVRRVETVHTPSISTNGSSSAWSGCLTATPTAISPPSDSDSGTPATAVTVMPRTDKHIDKNSAAQLMKHRGDDGSYHGVVGVEQLQDVSLSESNVSFLMNEMRSGQSANESSVLDLSGVSRSTQTETAVASATSSSGSNGGDAKRRSRSLFFSSGSNTSSESLLSFLLHEMSAVSGLGAITPLELSASSSSQATTSS